MSVSVDLPTRMRVPTRTVVGRRATMTSPVTRVPLVEPQSVTVISPWSCVTTQWRRETSGSASCSVHPGSRPTTASPAPMTHRRPVSGPSVTTSSSSLPADGGAGSPVMTAPCSRGGAPTGVSGASGVWSAYACSGMANPARTRAFRAVVHGVSGGQRSHTGHTAACPGSARSRRIAKDSEVELVLTRRSMRRGDRPVPARGAHLWRSLLRPYEADRVVHTNWSDAGGIRPRGRRANASSARVDQ